MVGIREGEHKLSGVLIHQLVWNLPFVQLCSSERDLAPPAVLVSGSVGWLISGSTRASGNDVPLTGLRLFPNFCGRLFLFSEHDTPWQCAPFCHNCNILVRVSSPQDFLILRDLLAFPPWAFAFAPTSRRYADSGVCEYAPGTGYPFKTTSPCLQVFSPNLLLMPQALCA